jgi:hypothetical protein
MNTHVEQHVHSPFSRRRIGLRWLSILFLVSMATSACGWFQEAPYFDVVNESNETLHLVSVNSDGVELELDVIEPGERYSDRVAAGECIDSVLIARTADGADFARQPQQMCADVEWIITSPDS